MVGGVTEQPTPTPPTPEVVQDQLSVTRHHITVNGQELAYTATAGTLVLRQEATDDGKSGGEKAKAAVFFTAYTLDDVADLRTRPLTFSFNGGPGSSSAWLHLGLLGPRRVVMGDAGALTGPPWDLADNPHTLLAHSDLVFIDPVSTGFSRAVTGEKPGDFHGFKGDLESVGDFIRLWTTRQNRWLSPKFLIGESYGTTRASALSGYLQDRHGLFLNGIMLVSSILDFSTVDFSAGNDLPYPLHFPTYAATGHYHGKVEAESLEALLHEAEDFAWSVYWPALVMGARLPDEDRRAVAEEFSRLTGVNAEFVLNADLRVDLFRFTKELLRDQHRTVGRLDSRFTGIDRDAGGEHFEYDPSMSAIQGPYTAAANHLLRAELGFESDLPYEVLTSRVWPWSYKEFENKHVQVAETLRAAMSKNPHLKIYVGSGYYDFATPYFATRYTLDRLGLDPSLRANIREHFYAAGHMMYAHAESLEAQGRDLADFLSWATGRADQVDAT